MRLRSTLALVLLALTTACSSWQTQNGPVPAVVARHGNDPLLIYRGDNRIIEMHNAVVTGDSIIGSVGTPPQRVAIATAEVTRIQVHKVSTARTGALAGGITAAVLVVAAFAVIVVGFGQIIR